MSRTNTGSDNHLPSGLPLDINVDSIPDAVLVTTPNTGQVVRANTTAGELFGCHSSELVGRHREELHPADDSEASAEAFQRSIDGGRVNSLQDGQPLYIKTLDGRHTPVDINAKRVDTSDGEFILSVFRTVTVEHDRGRRLETTTSRLETLLDALPIPVTVLDTDATVERWNDAAETTFGYAPDSVIGKPYPLFIEGEEFEQLIDQILDGGILNGYETTHRAKDGSRMPVELYARPLYEDDTLTGIVGTAVDLTDRQQREQQLDVLHRVLRHNLRNELNVITAWTQQFADGDGDQEKAIEKVKEASDRLLTLSREAKDIRTDLTGDIKQSEAIPITEGFSRLSEQVAERGTVTIRVSEKPDQGKISRRGLRGVSQLFDRVLSHIDETTVELAIKTHDRHVELEVAAPGSILPAGARAFITTGEETALEHGNDLSVPKANLLIESIGGDVTITVDGEGTPANTLTVDLPRVDGSDRPPQR